MSEYTDKYFPPKQKEDPKLVWLQAEDISDDGLTLQIAAVKEVNLPVKKNGSQLTDEYGKAVTQLRVLLEFTNSPKKFILRNWMLHKAAVTVLGTENPEEWIGGSLTFIVIVEPNKKTGGEFENIRIKVPRNLLKTEAKNEEIPF